MENAGKSKKSEVVRFVEDLRWFANEVIKESSAMKRQASNLGSSWNDPQYDKFKEYIDSLTRELETKVKSINDCANKIEEREIKEI